MNFTGETRGVSSQRNEKLAFKKYLMDERFYFKDKTVRKEFFECVRKETYSRSWRELAQKFNLYRTHFQDYQYGLHWGGREVACLALAWRGIEANGEGLLRGTARCSP